MLVYPILTNNKRYITSLANSIRKECQEVREKKSSFDFNQDMQLIYVEDDCQDFNTEWEFCLSNFTPGVSIKSNQYAMFSKTIIYQLLYKFMLTKAMNGYEVGAYTMLRDKRYAVYKDIVRAKRLMLKISNTTENYKFLIVYPLTTLYIQSLLELAACKLSKFDMKILGEKEKLDVFYICLLKIWDDLVLSQESFMSLLDEVDGIYSDELKRMACNNFEILSSWKEDLELNNVMLRFKRLK